jgi:hypothetical protein
LTSLTVNVLSCRLPIAAYYIGYYPGSNRQKLLLTPGINGEDLLDTHSPEGYCVSVSAIKHFLLCYYERDSNAKTAFSMLIVEFPPKR